MKTRRRIFKIKTTFQNQLILETTLVAFVFTNFLIVLMFLFSEGGYNASLLKLRLAVILAVGQVMGLVLVYRYSLKASHRIAGPLWSLEKKMTRLGKGDLTVNVRLRENDHLKDTAALFNETVEELRKSISAVKATADALRNEQDMTNRIGELVATLVRQLDLLRTETYEIDAPSAETRSITPQSSPELSRQKGSALV